MASVDVVLGLLRQAFAPETKEAQVAALDGLASLLHTDAFGTVSLMLRLVAGDFGDVDEVWRFQAMARAKVFFVQEYRRESFDAAQLATLRELAVRAVFVASRPCRRLALEVVKVLLDEGPWNLALSMCAGLRDSLPTMSRDAVGGAVDLVYVDVRRFKVSNLVPEEERARVAREVLVVLPIVLGDDDPYLAWRSLKCFECVVEVFAGIGALADSEVELLKGWWTFMVTFVQRVMDHRPTAMELPKAIKRAAMISFTLMHMASTKKRAPPIAQLFVASAAVPFYDLWARWLSGCPLAESPPFAPSVVAAIKYIKVASQHAVMYRERVHPQFIDIVRTLFRHLCFSEEDAAMFGADASDLQDYAQYMVDETAMEETTPRQAATNTILALLQSKRAFHDTTLVYRVLQTLSEGLSQPNVADADVFGYVHLWGHLRAVVKRLPDVWSAGVEYAQTTTILPRLQAPQPLYVRAKAAWACGRYAKAPISDEALQNTVVGLGSLLEDADPRLRLTAINAMCEFIPLKRGRPFLSHYAVRLTRECAAFLERVQTPFIPIVINYLATYFGPELASVLDVLCHCLVQQCLAGMFEMRACEESDVVDDEAQLKSMERVGMSCFTSLSAINQLVINTHHSPDILRRMVPDLVRLVDVIVDNRDGFEFVDSALEVLRNTLFLTDPIPEECWPLLPKVMRQLLAGDAIDSFGKVEGVLDNFISHGTERYLGNAECMRATMSVLEKVLVGGCSISDEDVSAAPQLIEAMFHQAKGRCEVLLAPYVEPMVELLLRRLQSGGSEDSDEVKSWLVAAMMDALWYDAPRVLAFLQDKGAPEDFFQAYTAFLMAPDKRGHGRSDATGVASLSLHHRKVHILGLSSALRYHIDPTTPRPFAEATAHALLGIALDCAGRNAAARKRRLAVLHKALQGGSESDSSVESDDDLDIQADEGDDDGGAAARDEADDDDEEDVGEGETDDNYVSPIDGINDITMLIETCMAAVAQREAFAQALGVDDERSLREAESVTQQYMTLMREYEEFEKRRDQQRAAHAASLAAS